MEVDIGMVDPAMLTEDTGGSERAKGITTLITVIFT